MFELTRPAGGTDRPATFVDEKGKLRLPPAPSSGVPADLCGWLTVVLALAPAHPVIRGAHEGLRGAAGHVVLERLGAPPLRFEPAARIQSPMRLLEDRVWQGIPSDAAAPPFKAEHCRVIAHVVRQLCGAEKAITDLDETVSIVSAFLGAAVPVEGHMDRSSPAGRRAAAPVRRMRQPNGGFRAPLGRLAPA